MIGSGDTSPIFTLTAGPAGATPATLAALGRPLLYDYDPAFLDCYANAVGLLAKAFSVDDSPVVLHGEAVLGLEAIAASVLGPDDIMLNLVSGHYARGFGAWASRYAGKVIDLGFDWNRVVDADVVAAFLDEHPEVTVVSVVHVDTPSGTRNDLDAISAVVKGHGALLLIDAVASFAGERCDFTGWGADVALVGTQKCLGGPPGLSLIHVSEPAWRHIETNPTAPRSSVLSLLDWRNAHKPEVRFPFTPSVSEIYALHSVLEQYLAEGAAAVRARHVQAANATRAGVLALGLELWPAEIGFCADTVTALKVPEGIDDAELRLMARTESSVMISGGQGSLSGNVFRIGHMGPGAYPMAPVLSVTAVGRALRKLGHPAPIGDAIEAVLAAL